MKAKKLLAVLLAVCLCLSALPMAMFTVVAEYASADYLTVECNTTIGATSKTETNSNGNYGDVYKRQGYKPTWAPTAKLRFQSRRPWHLLQPAQWHTYR